MRLFWGSTLFLLLCGASMPAAEVKPSGDAKWIEDVGGAVVRDPAGRVTGVDLRASWVTDLDLRKLLQRNSAVHTKFDNLFVPVITNHHPVVGTV